MTNVIKLRKGLNINLKGKAKSTCQAIKLSREYGLIPDGFEGITPKVVVNVGDRIMAGDALFVNKKSPEVKFASPVSGVVATVERGERRKVLCVKIEADETIQYHDYGKHNLAEMNGDDVKHLLLDAGLFGYINQLPYAISTTPDATPKGIFVSALRDMPLAADFEVELKGNENDFQTGLTALSKIAKTHLGIGASQNAEALRNAKDVDITVFDGPCPAGNVGVQINHISPVNKGEIVWTVDPSAVIFFGRLLNTGKVDLRRKIALAGSMVNDPQYYEVIIGTPIVDLVGGKIKSDNRPRIINGNPLTGKKIESGATTQTQYLLPHASEVTVIPEGNEADEMLGWAMPRANMFSTHHSYLSWLFGKKREYDIDARVKGGERHMIMSGEYDKVLPMDIYGEYLIKAIIAGDIDRQEQLGIYEVSPEDFALAEFVDSSKLELQNIVRQGLNTLRKENE